MSQRSSGKSASARRRAGWAFVGAGVVLTLLIGAYAVLPTVRERLSRAGEDPSPDFAAILSPGAPLPGPQATVRIEDVPLPSYVVGFRQGYAATLALATWNRYFNRYDWVSVVGLGAGQPALVDVASVTLEDLGRGASVLVVRGPSGGAYTSGVTFAVRDGDRLRRVVRTDADGIQAPAAFLEGSSVQHRDAVQLTDVDADGRKEVVTLSASTDARGREQAKLAVYRFENGNLAYDKQLTATAEAGEGLFPEPSVGTPE